MAEITVPEAPNYPGLPQTIRQQWRKTYGEAFLRAQKNHPNEVPKQYQVAASEANRIFDVAAPETYAAAMRLEAWQCLLREDRGGVLKVVLIDGRKFSFDVPPAEPEKKKKE